MKESRQTSMSFSHLILNLYGQKHYIKVKDYQSVETAKIYFIRIITSIKHSINQTIEVSDKHQIINLINILNVGEKNLKLCKTFSEIDQTFITIQTKLIFQLIGYYPNNSQEKNIINKKERWKLNPIRQIQYTQNNKQKEIAIFQLIQTRFLDKFGSWSDFLFLYHKECNNNINNLIEYLKLNHLEIYNEI